MFPSTACFSAVVCLSQNDSRNKKWSDDAGGLAPQNDCPESSSANDLNMLWRLNKQTCIASSSLTIDVDSIHMSFDQLIVEQIEMIENC